MLEPPNNGKDSQRQCASAHAARDRRDAPANVPLQVGQNMRIFSLVRQSTFSGLIGGGSGESVRV